MPQCLSRTPEYLVWRGLFSRCSGNRKGGHEYYQLKGIKVCRRWRSFSAFLKDMGRRPPGHQIDRINGSKGYSPANCRWVTPEENATNRSSTHWVTWRGKTLSVSQWARKLGITRETVVRREKRGAPLA